MFFIHKTESTQSHNHYKSTGYLTSRLGYRFVDNHHNNVNPFLYGAFHTRRVSRIASHLVFQKLITVKKDSLSKGFPLYVWFG